MKRLKSTSMQVRASWKGTDAYKAWKDATNDTTSWNLWLDAVLAAVSSTMEEIEPYKSKLMLWYRSGEPVWMAVDGLSLMLHQRGIQERADREVSFLKSRLKQR